MPCTFNLRDKSIEFRSSDIFPPEWVIYLSGAEVSDDEGIAMAQAISVLSDSGKAPRQLAADLAAAQQEIATLRAALERLKRVADLARSEWHMSGDIYGAMKRLEDELSKP